MASREGQPAAACCGPLLACDVLLGAPRVPQGDYRPDRADLLAELDRLGISGAVVRHRASLEVGGYFGNEVLGEELAGEERLVPAWFVTPDGREPAFEAAALVAEMLAAGVRLAWTDAIAESFSLQPWCCGPLYAALQDRRVPLLLSCANLNFSDLHQALTEYPQLRVILIDVPRLGRPRLIEPLLAQHPGLYLCFGPSFSVHQGFRDLCERYGPYRWVWGMGYPDCEGGAAISGLTYSGLTAEEMAAVAHGNLRRLLGEVEG